MLNKARFFLRKLLKSKSSLQNYAEENFLSRANEKFCIFFAQLKTLKHSKLSQAIFLLLALKSCVAKKKAELERGL